MKNLFNLIFILILSVSLSSCNKDFDDNSCNVKNPTKELSWLKEEIEEVIQDEFSYYSMAKYKGETVFYYGNCNPVVNYYSALKNCNGDILGNKNDFEEELTDITIIWKHQNSTCNL